MRQGRKIGCFILFVGLVFTSGRAAVLSSEPAKAERPKAEAPREAEAGKVAARVNGEPIYEEPLKAEVERSLAGYRRHGMRQDSPDLAKELRAKAMDTMIAEKLVSQESRKLTLDDVEARVARKVTDLEARFGAGQGVEKYLKRRSLTLEDFKKSARANVYVEEYLKRQGIAEPEIPEESIRRVYQDNPDGFRREEAVKVSHVLIAADDHTGADKKEEARQKAERIRAEIAQGKDFAEMAKKHSTCKSASGGGDLGFITKRFMPKEFDEAAFSLEKGAISKVVKTKFGYHIIKVVDKTPAGVAPYEDVKDFIRKYLQKDESKKKLAAHIVELRKKAKIEIVK